MASCKFCGNHRPLVDAHIVPRAFYRLPTADGKPHILVSNIANSRPQRSRTGIYDPNMLCAECDQMLGRFDQHAAEKLLNAKGTILFRDHEGPALLAYDAADANKVHAFVVAVAWRAAHAEHGFFGRVSLGPYEDILRRSIGGDGEARKRIDIFICEFDKDDASFINPFFTRFEGVKHLVIYANRFIFYVKVDRQPPPAYFRPTVLCAGKRVLSTVRQWDNSKELAVMRRLVQSHQTPSWVNR